MPTALIAEDEPLLRAELREMLTSLWPELSISAEVADGQAVLDTLSVRAPDIVFLDIRMPGLNGLEVAQQIGGRCHVVFVTAHDKYAVAAFEQGAVDYVLKPLQKLRLAATVTRLKEKLHSPPADLRDLLVKLTEQQPKNYLRWIQASVGSQLHFVTTEEIIYFQADAKYIRVVTIQSESLIRKPIKDLIEQLDPEQFWQIHRGTIINIRYIQTVLREGDGLVEVKMKHRTESLKVSQPYQHRFRQM